ERSRARIEHSGATHVPASAVALHPPQGPPMPLTPNATARWRAERPAQLTNRRRCLPELLQLRLPEFRLATGTMAARVPAGRDQVDAAVLDTLDFALQEPGFRRIALVVC